MSVLSTTLLAFSMSADAFAVAVGKGASLRRPQLAEALRTGMVFGAIEALTPIVGWMLGTVASTFVTSVDHWLAFIILAALGFKMIYEGIQKSGAQTKPSRQRHNLRSLALAGLGSSIDAMGVGVTLAFVEANIWITAAAIGMATFLMASIGIMTGHIIGSRAGKWAEAFGGVILIGIGTKILLGHTGYL